MTTILANITTDVDVEIEIEDLSDDELRACLKEAERRNMIVNDYYEREYVEEARLELAGGRPLNALSLIERALEPPIEKTTRAAYDQMMADAASTVKPMEHRT